MVLISLVWYLCVANGSFCYAALAEGNSVTFSVPPGEMAHFLVTPKYLDLPIKVKIMVVQDESQGVEMWLSR